MEELVCFCSECLVNIRLHRPPKQKRPEVCAAKARTAEALDQAITEALKTITPANATAGFSHCGYLSTATLETL